MAIVAIVIWPDEAVEVMHLAAPGTPVYHGPRLRAVETGVNEYPDPCRALAL
jgi:hypothetical protein